MVKIGISLRSCAIVVSALSWLSLCAISWADPPESDAGGRESSNGTLDVRKTEHEEAEDANHDQKTHAHTQKKPKSALDLLGIKKETDPESSQKRPSDGSDGVVPIRPPNATKRPSNDFRRNPPRGAGAGFKGHGKKRKRGAVAAIPKISDDKESADFILQQLVTGAQIAALERGETPEKTEKLNSTYSEYARRLAKTLSKLTLEQQNRIFYGK